MSLENCWSALDSSASSLHTNQGSAIARSIFPMFFQISPFCFAFCHFVMIFSKRKSGSFCSVKLHKQPESAVFLQKSKQSWQKTKQMGDIWKNLGENASRNKGSLVCGTCVWSGNRNTMKNFLPFLSPFERKR